MSPAFANFRAVPQHDDFKAKEEISQRVDENKFPQADLASVYPLSPGSEARP